jgi:hypothetical protein
MYIKMSRGYVQNFPSRTNGMIHMFERLRYQAAWRHQNVAERDRDVAKSTLKLSNAWFRMKNDMLTLPTAYEDLTRFKRTFRYCSPF